MKKNAVHRRPARDAKAELNALLERALSQPGVKEAMAIFGPYQTMCAAMYPAVFLPLPYVTSVSDSSVRLPR